MNVMKPSAQPMSLATPRTALPLTWNLQGKSLSIDDYFQRHPVMALLIAKDGEIVFERYQFGLTAEHRFLSNSMAKSITGLGMGLARAGWLHPELRCAGANLPTAIDRHGLRRDNAAKPS